MGIKPSRYVCGILVIIAASVSIWVTGCQNPGGGSLGDSTMEAENDHGAEVAAARLIADFSLEELPVNRPTIPVHRRLEGNERSEAVKRLQETIQSQEWKLSFTNIVVTDGIEDVATCFFRSETNDHLVLMLATLDQEWIVTGYEIAPIPWARLGGQPLEEYVEEMVTLTKEQGIPYTVGPLEDGLYFREFSSPNERVPGK